MNYTPKVSVIMSVYNDYENIEFSVNSILNQNYENLEFLIMDDCSTDSTPIILRKFKTNKKIKLFRNKVNIGLTKSLNILIKESTGELIARQDSDDISFVTRIKDQVDFIKANNIDGCSTKAKIKNFDNVIPKYSHKLPPKLIFLFKNPFLHGTFLIFKDAIENVGMYDENFYFAQDYKLTSDLIKQGYKFKTLNKVLYQLNIEDNLTSKNLSKQKQAAEIIKTSNQKWILHG